MRRKVVMRFLKTWRLPSENNHALESKPFLLESRSSKWFIISTVALAVFTDVFLYAVIVPVIPFAIESRVGVNSDRVQYWVSVLLAVYSACLFAASPCCGYIADRTTSRRLPLLFGLLALSGATVLLCVGTSTAVLIAGRALQGVSAAIVWTCGLALIVDTCPDEIASAMGYVSLALSLSILIAPLLGGIVFANGGYYDVFAMCFGLLGLDILMRLLLIEKKTAKRWLLESSSDEHKSELVTSSDQGEQATIMDSGMIDAHDSQTVAQSNQTAVLSPPLQSRHCTEASTGISGLDAVVHLVPLNQSQISVNAAETVQPMPGRLSYNPSLPPVLTLLLSRRFLATLFACLIQAALITAFDAILPIYVHSVFHWNSLGGGLIFLPIVIPSFASPLVGAWVDKHGTRWPASLGFLLAVPFLALLQLVTDNSLRQKALLCAMLAGFGGALTFSFPPLMAEIAYVVDAKEKRRPGAFGRTGGAFAQGYALFNCAYAAGCAIGPILSGFIKQRGGWAPATWTLAILSGFTFFPTVIFVGGGRILYNKNSSEIAEKTTTFDA